MPKRVWRAYSTRQIQSDICVSASILSGPVLLPVQAAVSIYPEGIIVLPSINNEQFRWRQSSNRESKSRTNKTKENSSELTCFVKLAAKQAIFPAVLPYCQLSDLTSATSHIPTCHLPAHRYIMTIIKKDMGNSYKSQRLSMQHASFFQSKLHDNKCRNIYCSSKEKPHKHTAISRAVWSFVWEAFLCFCGVSEGFL